MAWRLTALSTPLMTQFGMDWGLCIGSLIIVLPTAWTVSETTRPEDEVTASFSRGEVKGQEA